MAGSERVGDVPGDAQPEFQPKSPSHPAFAVGVSWEGRQEFDSALPGAALGCAYPTGLTFPNSMESGARTECAAGLWGGSNVCMRVVTQPWVPGEPTEVGGDQRPPSAGGGTEQQLEAASAAGGRPKPRSALYCHLATHTSIAKQSF